MDFIFGNTLDARLKAITGDSVFQLFSGLTDRVWSIEGIIGLLEMAEKDPAA